MLVVKGQFLLKGFKKYEVIMADEEYFLVGERTGNRTSFENLAVYSNLESINTLEQLGFTEV